MINSRAPDVYRGLEDPRHTSRSKSKIEEGWKRQSDPEQFPENLRVLDVDSELTKLAESALQANRNQVVGWKGFLLVRFMTFNNTHNYIHF